MLKHSENFACTTIFCSSCDLSKAPMTITHRQLVATFHHGNKTELNMNLLLLLLLLFLTLCENELIVITLFAESATHQFKQYVLFNRKLENIEFCLKR